MKYESSFKSEADGLEISVMALIPDKKPYRAVVQLVHGMSEHKERYIPFMQYLAKLGYVVVIHDHRGHGKSVKHQDDLGFTYGGGAQAMLQDIRTVNRKIHAYYPELPLILMGHSMGSLAVRAFVAEHDSCADMLIVCGSPSYNTAMPLGVAIAKTEKAVFGPRHRSKLIETMSFGAGAMPDAADYGDAGTDTMGHISESVEELHIPNLQKLGIANLHPLKQVAAVERPMGYYTFLKEASTGKDTMTGHWEMMGLHITKPFKTFTETGFPKELIDELEKRTGHKVIGNKSSSGTEILDELAEEEIATGHMIVYTSADSVLQICGNEETFGLDELYRCCEIARDITMRDEWKVGRVIARPYLGKKKGEFKRTSNRHDYALKPYGKTALNALKDAGLDVIGVGKINDIFCGEGITQTYHSDSSVHGMQQTIEICKEEFHGLCFVNLVDFDALWGHRRNPEGYGREIEKFDSGLGTLMNELREDDLLILTADHGNDPTYTGTDHTREYVPFIAYSKRMKNGGAIKDEDTFAVIGASVAENFGVPMPEGTIGHSVLKELM